MSKTNRDVALLKEFLRAKEVDKEIENLEAKELDEVLCAFIVEVKTKGRRRIRANNIEVVHFKLRPLDPRLSVVNSFSITLNNNVIKRVFHFTYLGIVFDDRLSWNEHIKHLISKAGKRVGMLGRLRGDLTRESANIVYCSLIRPILEYCVSVWGCCGVGHKQDLEALQNRAARIVARTVRSNPAMDVLKWPTLVERRRKSVFKLVNAN